jgi:hypothetical protein
VNVVQEYENAAYRNEGVGLKPVGDRTVNVCEPSYFHSVSVPPLSTSKSSVKVGATVLRTHMLLIYNRY